MVVNSLFDLRTAGASAAAGLYPTTSEDLIKGDDLGFHLFADYQAEAPDRWFQGTIGFQQTWHEGETDRSLLIGRVNARPTRDLSLFGSILIDLYGSEDTIKSQAAEITQFVAQASYQFNPRTGVNGSVMRSSWPELKRNEYVSFPPELLTDGFVDRVSATLWRKVPDQIRVSARSHAWRDQDMNGFGGEVSADWYVRGPGNPSYYGSLYYEDSAFTRGVGARLQARRDIGQVRVFAGYDLFASTADSQFGDDADLVRHTLRGSVSWSRGRWTWDLETEYTFGDAEQSIGLNAYGQYRF